MRVAYIAPYQGPDLLQRRPIVSNLSLGGNVKIELVSELLHRVGYDVEVLSQGEAGECRFRLFPGFQETKKFHSEIPVFYSSALPVRFVQGFWSNWRTRRLFSERHAVRPFDIVIIYNLKRPQVACATHAIKRFGLPVVVEYEDDAFVDIGGRAVNGFKSKLYLKTAQCVLEAAAGGIGVSPHLLSRMPGGIPKMLLRGVVDEDILKAGKRSMALRKNWVVYSGTHYRSKGLEPLITAWKTLNLPGWELHIAGHGELTGLLEQMVKSHKSIIFHGLLNRQEYACFLGEAKIGINPHDLSDTPGNVFAFKIIEYLAAGAHCVTTPMGELEPKIEAGITYLFDNQPATIAATLKQVITSAGYERLSARAAQDAYGPEAVAESLNELLKRVMTKKQHNSIIN
jgi:glycosyltransferase involved in cell wall biosynthesis